MGPAVFERARLSGWLARHAEVPLRLLTGPAGAGKTTAIATYLASREGRCAFVTLKDDETPEALRARFAQALGLDYVPASFPALLAAVATLAPCEIVVDELERGTPETLEELEALVAEAPQGISFIYASRARGAIDVRRFLVRGLAATLEGWNLAFDADDVIRLAEKLAVPFAPTDVVRLLEETEGWPLVTSWVVREAAGTQSGLEGAYERWRQDGGRHFREFLHDELRRAGEAATASFRSGLRGLRGPDERERLAELEARGLFVYHADGGYRPYRVARQFDLEAIPAASALGPEPAALLVVRMFGRFEAEIGGRRIDWIRRREAQLFKYLLLKPNGSATRSELREVFWPEADSHLATQSLRTASSNIRKAIATIVGYGNVERYFASRGDIAVRLEQTVLDVRRFTAHVADGDAELERGRAQEAFAHYRAAESLYSGELLAGEYPEPWYVPRAEMFKSLYVAVLERLSEYHADAGHARQAREYAARRDELCAPLSLARNHSR